MNNLIVNDICFKYFNKYPSKVKQFEMGYGNYVFKIHIGYDKFVLRLNAEKNAYKDTIYWIEELSRLELPIPKVINKGIYSEFSYLILNYIEGDDLGNVYVELSTEEKREIAKKIVNIQNAVSRLPQSRGYGYLNSYEDENYKKNWKEVVLEHLDRSRNRIRENKIFDYQKVDKVEALLDKYDDYFNLIMPVPFLDDISSKNVLIDKGKLSGIIDIDWICFGDKIYTVALTNMALISLGYDTKYIDYLLEEMKASELEREILWLYTLVFCVDFMSEKGMKFKDEVVKVSEKQVEALNKSYDELVIRLNN